MSRRFDELITNNYGFDVPSSDSNWIHSASCYTSKRIVKYHFTSTSLEASPRVNDDASTKQTICDDQNEIYEGRISR